MIGFFALIHNYVLTGWAIPGIFQISTLKNFIHSVFKMNEKAELQNGRWAMIGIFAALGTYAATGQIIPGIF